MSGNTVEMQAVPSVYTGDLAVALKGASIRPATESDIVLHDINFELPKGSLTMLIGVVGSGKSTLLKAILGELKCASGEIQVASTTMSYCSQAVWIPNATVRHIICGITAEEDIDQDWYERTVFACALNEDISRLVDGDGTLVGSRGIALSGGQKQRLVSLKLNRIQTE